MEAPQTHRERREVILVVEDDAALAELITGILQDEGWKAEKVGTGKDALEWLSRNTPDLVLLDYSLPDTTAARFIEQVTVMPPFIIATGQGDERIAVDMMKRGALDYLVKDENFLDILAMAVQRVVEQIEDRKELRLNEQRLAGLLELSRLSGESEMTLTDFALDKVIQLTCSRIGYLAFLEEDEKTLNMYTWSRNAPGLSPITDKPSNYPLETTELWSETVRRRRPIITNDCPEPPTRRKRATESRFRLTRHMDIPLFDGKRIVLVAGVGNKSTPYDEKDIRQATLLMDGMWKILKQTRAQEAIRRNEATLRGLLTAAPVAFAVGRDRVMSRVNSWLCQMVGYTREELEGSPTRMLYAGPEEYDRVGRELYACQTASVRGSVEAKWRRKDGAMIDVLLNSSIIDPENPSLGYALTAIDITDKKRAEEERLNLERQVQQAQKLESLGVLAGGIAHDFNNLLTAILGYVNLAMEDVSPASPALIDLQEAEKASRRAADLARQMLAYSGRGRFLVQRLDLREVVEGMAQMLQVSVSRKVQLQYKFGYGVPPVEADAAQLRQVVLNLVINASDAIGDRNGVVAISTGTAECTPADLAEPWQPNPVAGGLFAYVEVEDTGCGISAEHLSRIFDPFFTTKFTGRGLGLAAVLGIVRGHQGAVKVRSAPGKGSVFRVLLPAAAAPAAQPDHRVPSAEDRHGRGAVLLVDEEESVRAIGRRMLERIGFEALSAGEVGAALELCATHGSRIRCVVLDLTMARTDSEAFLRDILRVAPSVPLILSSDFDEQDARRQPEGERFAGFIQKPYTFNNLLETLRRVLGESLGPA
ncbi:MAG: response regulator [Acidobacteria bacterium]|nr:response regulator [Acidobacteriota bacterium]